MPLASTQTDIANLALARLGHPPINDLDAGTEPARTLKELLAPTVLEVQADYEWPELTARASLTLHEAGTTDHEENWSQYLIPRYCIRPIELEDGYPFYLEGAYLRTSASSPVLRYVRYDESPGSWSVQLARSVYMALAVKVCMSITQNATLLAALQAQYERIDRPEAKVRAARGRSSTQYRPRWHNWISTRFRTGGRI